MTIEMKNLLVFLTDVANAKRLEVARYYAEVANPDRAENFLRRLRTPFPTFHRIPTSAGCMKKMAFSMKVFLSEEFR
jgi:hypothetical protein